MRRGSLGAGWLVLVSIAACGGGDPRASGQPGAPAVAAAPAKRPAAASPAPGSASSAEPRKLPLDADNARRLVRDLIEAFQDGDRAKVEALWAADGGTWTDQAGFEQRARYYQEMEFQLEPETMETADRSGLIVVVARANKEGAEWLWTFYVSEIGGALRAGGVEVRAAGTP